MYNFNYTCKLESYFTHTVFILYRFFNLLNVLAILGRHEENVY